MLSEEEKKAIEYWKRDISLYHYNTQLASEHYAQIILNLIEKQEKIIDKMATECSIQTGRWENLSKEEIIEYFTKKVSEEE